MKRTLTTLAAAGLFTLLPACTTEDTGTLPAPVVDVAATSSATTTTTRDPYPYTPTPAPADDTAGPEWAYIATLDIGTIYYSSEEAAIETGRQICDTLDEGADLIDIAVAAAGSYSIEDAGYITGAAISAFCPWHSELIAE